MRILVFSDTHGDISRCTGLLHTIKDVDMVIHAGDVSADAAELASAFPNIPIKSVRGNCEVSVVSADELTVADGYKIFITHGHKYNVKNESSYSTLINHAKSLGADAVVFGHTHIPLCDNIGGMWVLNPGSIKYGATYGVIEIEDGKFRACVLDV